VSTLFCEFSGVGALLDKVVRQYTHKHLAASVAALLSRSASTQCAPDRLSATTPAITSAMPSAFPAVSGSFSSSIPMMVIAAVPPPDQIAYATLTCSWSLSAWASRAKESR
jgi:hypothetical protein